MLNELLGLRIVVIPYLKPTPKLQVSLDFEWCTDNARQKMNAWLLERFGAEERILFIDRGPAIVSPRVMGLIKNVTA